MNGQRSVTKRWVRVVVSWRTLQQGEKYESPVGGHFSRIKLVSLCLKERWLISFPLIFSGTFLSLLYPLSSWNTTSLHQTTELFIFASEQSHSLRLLKGTFGERVYWDRACFRSTQSGTQHQEEFRERIYSHSYHHTGQILHQNSIILHLPTNRKNLTDKQK